MLWMKRLLALAVVLMTIITGAAAEVQLLPHVAGWTADGEPLRLTVTCEVLAEASSGEKRLEQLGKLMKHLSLQVDVQQLLNETWSRSSVMVDDKPALTLLMRETPEMTLLQASPLKDVTIQAGADVTDPLSSLTGQATEGLSFRGMNGSGAAWLKDAETLLANIPELLAAYGSAKKSDIAIKNMGKATLKTTCDIPEEDAGKLAKLLSSACPEGELKTLLGKLTFEGKQQFLIYQNAEGAIIKLVYEGTCGAAPEDMRKASFSWSLRRDDTNTRDTMTLKTPGIKGSDRNNLTFGRIATVSDKGVTRVQIDSRYEEVVDKKMTSWVCEADLKTTNGEDGVLLTGQFALKNTTPDDVTAKLILTPELMLGMDRPAASGTVMVEKTRKGETELKAKLGLALGTGEYFNWDMTNTTLQLAALEEENLVWLREQLASGAATALVRRIALLPKKDTLYLFDGISESTRKEIVRIAREAIQEEEAQ